MKTRLSVFLLLTILLAAACTPQATLTPAADLPAESTLPAPTEPVAVSPTESTPATSAPTESVVPATEAVPATSVPAAEPSRAWKEVRDTRYGFGLAVPCWWLVTPIPEQAMGGVMTIANYDETYFAANSNKGYWDWPNGTLKIDIAPFEGVDPNLSDVDAYMKFVDTSMEGLVSSETKQIGAHTMNVLTMQNMVNQNEPPYQIFILRLAADKLLLINPIPKSIINTPDFQTMLNSLVLTPQEQVVLPTTDPSATPLIEASCAGQ